MGSKPSKLGLTHTIHKATNERITVSQMKMPLKLRQRNRTILRHHTKGRIKVKSKEDSHPDLGLSGHRLEPRGELAILSIKDTDTTPQLIIRIHSQLTLTKMLCSNLG